MTETDRHRLNTERLLLIDAGIRTNVLATISALEAQGLRPLIAKEVWRDPKTQLALFNAGRSKVRWGFHCATTKDGKPGSLAADIVDCEVFWNAPRVFWLKLGDAALENGLYWGGFFGLNSKQRDLLLESLRANDYISKITMGFDPAHVEVRGLSIAEVRAGKRP